MLEGSKPPQEPPEATKSHHSQLDVFVIATVRHQFMSKPDTQTGSNTASKTIQWAAPPHPKHQACQKYTCKLHNPVPKTTCMRMCAYWHSMMLVMRKPCMAAIALLGSCAAPAAATCGQAAVQHLPHQACKLSIQSTGHDRQHHYRLTPIRPSTAPNLTPALTNTVPAQALP